MSRGTPREHTRDDVRDALRAAATAVGEPLSVDDYRAWRADHPDEPSIATIWTRDDAHFDGWTEATAAAGVTATDPSAPYYKFQYDRADMLDAIRAAAADLGEPLAAADYTEWALAQDETRPVSQTVVDSDRSEFDSWRTACEAAGVVSAQASASMLVRGLRECAADLGTDRLSALEWDLWARDRPYPLADAVAGTAGRFDSWDAALAAADLEPTDGIRFELLADAVGRERLAVAAPPDLATDWTVRRVGDIVDPDASDLPTVDDLEAIREHNDLSKRAFAIRLGVSPTRYYRWLDSGMATHDRGLAAERLRLFDRDGDR